MFDILVASRACARDRRLAPSGAIAFFAHLTLGAAAVWGSLRAAPATRVAPPPPILVWPQRPEPRPLPEPRAPVLDPVGPLAPDCCQPMPHLPPLESGAPRDPDLWVRLARLGAPRGIAGTDPSAPWFAPDVEEPPVLLVSRPPAYPESLRRAGIGGRVVIEAVIDSAGQVEPGSVRVIASPERGFAAAAQDYVLRALFRPARVHGRAVRVLVRVPIDFTLASAR
jgi:periplasmic protein TonB